MDFYPMAGVGATGKSFRSYHRRTLVAAGGGEGDFQKQHPFARDFLGDMVNGLD